MIQQSLMLQPNSDLTAVEFLAVLEDEVLAEAAAVIATSLSSEWYALLPGAHCKSSILNFSIFFTPCQSSLCRLARVENGLRVR